jgi:hypothetical protein
LFLATLGWFGVVLEACLEEWYNKGLLGVASVREVGVEILKVVFTINRVGGEALGTADHPGDKSSEDARGIGQVGGM